MIERADLLRVDATGMIHPLGKTASQELRARAGEWRIIEGPLDVLLMRRAGTPTAPVAVLKLAGEIRTPGAMCDIVALAFQADRTRIATLLLSRDLSGQVVFSDDGSGFRQRPEDEALDAAHPALRDARYAEKLAAREQVVPAPDTGQNAGTGVIRPPGGIDPGINKARPDTTAPETSPTPVVPPPGSPGGNPNVVPK